VTRTLAPQGTTRWRWLAASRCCGRRTCSRQGGAVEQQL
jgi:hypothetical protein